ncbi:hypothetical protein FGO68_gene15804 [Halteria grandinella]|uniref:Aminotransferase class I/classII large domain-containing protein n=1 Tax=Halteria grandinella TaxID=5974 RepID=A0A8J8T1Z7_HALGN|nr:hypothetical protein FGO68_gene15804 [Halteria grandinella]
METTKRTFPLRIDDNVAIWTEFKELTLRYNCLSLGEGAPGHNPPQFLVDNLVKAIEEGHNQYSRVMGIPELNKKIADVYGKKLGRDINWMTEIFVSAGANSAINSIILGIIDPKGGDEVVVFEPCFPQYQDHVQMANARYVPVPLDYKEGKWSFSKETFRAALNERTKILILNNAHNPTGKLFTLEELTTISAILKDFPNVIVLSDDVYEYLTYDGKHSIMFASLPDTFNKTVSVFSGGKLFSATGWKVGWAIGPADIINAASVISTTTIYCVNAPAQVAMGRCLGDVIETQRFKEEGVSYVQHTRKEFEIVRNYMIEELQRAPIDLELTPLPCESGFFVMVDISKAICKIPTRFLESHDYEILEEGQTPVSKNRVFIEGRVPYDLAFCRWMAVERGVIMMPNSLFYNKESPYRIDTLVRLSICKGYELSVWAVQRIKGKQKTE